jgi:hypothetical protein
VSGSGDSDGTCHIPHADARVNREPGKGQRPDRRFSGVFWTTGGALRMTASESNSGTLAELIAPSARVRRPVKLYEPE